MIVSQNVVNILQTYSFEEAFIESVLAHDAYAVRVSTKSRRRCCSSRTSTGLHKGSSKMFACPAKAGYVRPRGLRPTVGIAQSEYAMKNDSWGSAGFSACTNAM